MSSADDMTRYPVTKSDAEWRQQLDPGRFEVLRQAGTEQAWTGELLDEHRDGSFSCGACGIELFESGTKFESGSGWPSFYDAKPGAVELINDNSYGMTRTEVRCANCGSHLGHLFNDAVSTPTGMRYCMNSLALDFVPSGTAAAKAADTPAES